MKPISRPPPKDFLKPIPPHIPADILFKSFYKKQLDAMTPKQLRNELFTARAQLAALKMQKPVDEKKVDRAELAVKMISAEIVSRKLESSGGFQADKYEGRRAD